MTTWGKGIYERPDTPPEWFVKASIEIDDEETYKAWRRDWGHYAMAGLRAGEARAERYRKALEEIGSSYQVWKTVDGHEFAMSTITGTDAGRIAREALEEK